MTAARSRDNSGLSASQEHPLPEGFHTTLVCNVPWVIKSLWGTARRMLPARDAARVQLFKSGDPHFLRELTKHVAIEQVPRCFGGESDEPWPYHVEAHANSSRRA